MSELDIEGDSTSAAEENSNANKNGIVPSVIAGNVDSSPLCLKSFCVP